MPQCMLWFTGDGNGMDEKRDLDKSQLPKAMRGRRDAATKKK